MPPKKSGQIINFRFAFYNHFFPDNLEMLPDWDREEFVGRNTQSTVHKKKASRKQKGEALRAAKALKRNRVE